MTIEPNHVGDNPRIARTAFVHETAVLTGKVIVESRVFIGPHAVIRADEPSPDGTVQPILIGEESNVQDCATIRALGGTGVSIGPYSSIAHGAIVHSPCDIGRSCFVGFNSVIFRATLGDGALVMHQVLVDGVTIRAGCLVPSTRTVPSREGVMHSLKSGQSAENRVQLLASRPAPGPQPRKTMFAMEGTCSCTF